MRSKIITKFRRLITEDLGARRFALFGEAVVHQKLERRQIERCIKHCLNLTETDFSLKEAIEHFYRISWLAPEKSVKKLGSRKPTTSRGFVKPIETT